MSFTLERYSEVRPFLYHLTARGNVERIRSVGRLESTSVLLEAADLSHDVRTHRSEKLPIRVGAHEVLVRDQAPLHVGNIDFQGGWDLSDLVENLNRRVFFWSGWEHKPVDYGRNHFERYKHEQPAILRVRFDSLRARNTRRTPRFCRFNSGAPRCSQGRRSPRGPETFLPANRCPYTSKDVVEVTFLEEVILPADTEFSERPDGGWRLLFTEGQRPEA
jgi:hypothetical protein